MERPKMTREVATDYVGPDEDRADDDGMALGYDPALGTKLGEQYCGAVVGPMETEYELVVAMNKAPIVGGVLDYFPDAIEDVAYVSLVCNEQHNPGVPMHWDRTKSQDEVGSLMRHLMLRGKRDLDGCRHSAKVAWRALALLQKEIEDERTKDSTT